MKQLSQNRGVQQTVGTHQGEHYILLLLYLHGRSFRYLKLLHPKYVIWALFYDLSMGKVQEHGKRLEKTPKHGKSTYLLILESGY